MNYYDILGVNPNCDQEEIKKAYRSLAMKHHPDRGGDPETFKKISSAYDTLSDPAKKMEYDQSLMGGPQININSFGGFDDLQNIFGGMFQFGPGFAANFGRQIRRNKDLNIRCNITLRDSFLGKELEAAFVLPSMKQENVVIKLPPGVEHGQTIQYHGMGDDSFSDLPRGNLNVSVMIDPDPVFFRRENNVCMVLDIDPIEAMIGCVKDVSTIDGKTLQLKIRPGTNTNSEYTFNGMGFQNIRFKVTGNFVVIINVKIPTVIDANLKSKLESLRNEINKTSR